MITGIPTGFFISRATFKIYGRIHKLRRLLRHVADEIDAIADGTSSEVC